MKSIRYHQHTFIPGLIRNGGVVLDCGANRGDFSKWIVENTQAVVHGFEPTPELFAHLPDLPRANFHRLAIADQAGILKFNVGEDKKSSLHFAETLVETIEVQAVRLEDFCAQLGIQAIELLKMDIEGEEIPVLRNASDKFLQSIRQITVEFHDGFRPGDIPAIKEILKRLESLGFYVLRVSHRDYADILLMNEARVPVSTVDKIWFLLQGKYVRGIARNLKRRIGRLQNLEP